MLLSLSSFVDLFKYAAQAMINIDAALAACKYRDMRAKIGSAGLLQIRHQIYHLRQVQSLNNTCN
jgi:hypothetical protein